MGKPLASKRYDMCRGSVGPHDLDSVKCPLMNCHRLSAVVFVGESG